ncbi:MAG TPA: hypothetical protein PKW56_06700 [Clostridiales bacterium]|nr:hypothetical protein [Clostridiales bacterium]
MVQENEIITFLLFTLVMIFYFINRKKLLGFPRKKYFLTAMILLLISSVLTIIEGFFFEEIINTAEHIFRLISSVMFFVWVYSSGERKGSEK